MTQMVIVCLCRSQPADNIVVLLAWKRETKHLTFTTNPKHTTKPTRPASHSFTRR